MAARRRRENENEAHRLKINPTSPAASIRSGSGIFLYGISRTDSLTYFSSGVLLTFVVVAACYIPARRAAKVDPVVALRYE